MNSVLGVLIATIVVLRRIKLNICVFIERCMNTVMNFESMQSAETYLSTKVVTAALALSRETLTDEKAARGIVLQLDDATELINFSAKMYNLPLVVKHLNSLRPGWCDPNLVNSVETSFSVASVLSRSEQKAFHKICIEPIQTNYAYIKGFALSQQFYKRPYLRFARDIDVLVSPNALNDVVRLALSNGYRILNITSPNHFLDKEQDIRAALRYQKVINLISPKGQHIEVHSKVDKSQGIFDEQQMLVDSRTIIFEGTEIRTLQPIDHFIYVAYHCARHNWSKLHWLVDLDAMVRSQIVPESQLIERASDMGLRGLIEETLGFIALSENAEVACEGDKGAQILAQTMNVLTRGEQFVLDLEKTQTSMALPFPEFYSARLRHKIHIKRLINRMSPQFSDYSTYPLPDSWQWIYHILGPTSRLIRKTFN